MVLVSQSDFRELRGTTGFSGEFERSLLKFYKMCAALHALSLDQDTFLANAEWHGGSLNVTHDMESHSSSYFSPHQEWALFDCLSNIIGVLARLNARYESKSFCCF
jgi:hypothetical protein